MRIENSCSGHIIDICYFLFYVRRRYQREVDGKVWIMEVRGSKEIVIIALFNHFAHVTNELDLFLPPRFPCKKTRKSHSYLAHGAGKVLVQEVQPVLSWSSQIFKNLPYCVSNNQPIAILRELIVYFIPLSDKCD